MGILRDNMIRAMEFAASPTPRKKPISKRSPDWPNIL